MPNATSTELRTPLPLNTFLKIIKFMLKYSALIFLLTLLSCSSSMQETTFTYKGEEATVVRYNASKSNLPLIIVFPDVDGSLLTEELIKRLAKNNRLTVVQFIGSKNKVRQQQLDNIQNRTNYYSDQLTLLTTLEKDSVTLLAEGLNANIASRIVNAMPINNYVLLNSYFPTLRDALTTTCYAQRTANCDSIIRFLDFGYRYAIDSVFVEIAKPDRDNQYGRYTTSYWKDIFPLPSTPQEGFYKGSITYLFTTNSGLAPTSLPKGGMTCSKAKLKETLSALIRN